jgi:hypothetical protein
MGILPHMSKRVKDWMEDGLSNLPKTTRTRLSDFVIGVLLAGTVVLRRVATTQAHVGLSPASAASHERRLRRTLNDPSVEVGPTYTRVVRRILGRLKPKQQVRLIIDESGHSDVARMLLIALWYRGRAIPLTWILWPAQQSHDQSYWADCAILLDNVASILPNGQRVTVIGDRAFGCPAFIDEVRARGWDYLVRVQGQTRMQDTNGKECRLRDLLAAPGQCEKKQGKVFKKQGWREACAVAYWRTGCSEPLLLVSSLPASLGLVREYRLRSAIEALFRDWKTSGWQWESSQVRDVKHQEVIVFILALATLVTLCLGEEAAQEILEREPQQGYRRPWDARSSLFRLGRERFWQRLWQGETPPILKELSQFNAPNWSQECWKAARPDPSPVYETERVGKREHLRLAA